MDEAFLPLDEILAGMLSFESDFTDDEEGVHSYVSMCEIESPIELEVRTDESGIVSIGSTPPIYYVDTSLRPSFHGLRFRADRDGDPHGG